MDSVKMERKGEWVYVDGQKVLQISYTKEDEHRRYVSLEPISIRQFRNIRPGATPDEYDNQMVAWLREYQDFDYKMCVADLKNELCFDKIEKHSKDLAKYVLAHIQDKCDIKVKQAKYDLYW